MSREHCDGCGKIYTTEETMCVTVGTSLIAILPNGKTPDTDIRAAAYTLCEKCRIEVKEGLASTVDAFVRGR